MSDYPQVIFERHKLIRHTRKLHKCSQCGQSIEIGTSCSYNVIFSTDDSVPFCYYQHLGTYAPLGCIYPINNNHWTR